MCVIEGVIKIVFGHLTCVMSSLRHSEGLRIKMGLSSPRYTKNWTQCSHYILKYKDEIFV